MKMKTINYDEVREYLKNTHHTSKIYLGADSERVNVDNVWYVDVLVCLIVHDSQKYGGKFFGGITRERDYDKTLNRPHMRMMMEAYAVSQLYLDLAEDLAPFDPEIHLDISPLKENGSNCAHSQAMGYVKGVTGLDPVCKGFAASNVADATKRLLAA